MSSLSVLCLQCTSSQGGGKKKPWVSTFQDVFSGQNVLEPNVNQNPGQERRWQTRIGSSRCV